MAPWTAANSVVSLSLTCKIAVVSALQSYCKNIKWQVYNVWQLINDGFHDYYSFQDIVQLETSRVRVSESEVRRDRPQAFWNNHCDPLLQEPFSYLSLAWTWRRLERALLPSLALSPSFSASARKASDLCDKLHASQRKCRPPVMKARTTENSQASDALAGPGCEQKVHFL